MKKILNLKLHADWFALSARKDYIDAHPMLWAPYSLVGDGN